MQSTVADLRLTLMSLLTSLQDAFLAAVVGVLAGTAAAGFIVALDAVTHARFAQPWLLALLPIAGVAMAWAYRLVRHGTWNVATTSLLKKFISRVAASPYAWLRLFSVPHY